MTETLNLGPETLLNVYEISSDDLDAVRSFGQIVVPKLSEYVEHFYSWMREQPEFAIFFSDEAKLHRVQQLQIDYWNDFFTGVVDVAYVKKRQEVGVAHARIGLSLSTYFAAMNRSLLILTEKLYDGSLDASAHASSVRAMTKLVHLDTAVVVDTFSRHTNRIIRDQQESLLEMSTPVTEIWQDILMIPIVGFIDSKRAQDIMTAVLTKISETHSRVLILDISGVAVVDTAVANHLFKITKATKLMGCTSTLSGISPAIAQTMVELGIDVGGIRTNATLREALTEAFRAVGAEIRMRT